MIGKRNVACSLFFLKFYEQDKPVDGVMEVIAGQGFDSPRLHFNIMDKNRFDLELEISELTSFSQQLETLSSFVENDDLSQGEVASAVGGISTLLDIHIKKLQDTFRQCFNLNKELKHDLNFIPFQAASAVSTPIDEDDEDLENDL